MKKIVFLACLSLAASVASSGQLVISSFSNYSQEELPKRLGVYGHVTLFWTNRNPNLGFGYIYGSGWDGASNGDTDIAIATGVTDISQITDASSYGFTDQYLVVNDGQLAGGVGNFVVMHNKVSDYFGVLRIDDIRPREHSTIPFDGVMDATWWFAADHGTDFSGPTMISPIPESPVYGIGAALMLGSLVTLRRRKRA